jgi:hypothetical protein
MAAPSDEETTEAICAAFVAVLKRSGGSLTFTHGEMNFKGAIKIASDDDGMRFEVVETEGRN